MKPRGIEEQLIADIEFTRRAEALISRLQKQHEAERLGHPSERSDEQRFSPDDEEESSE